jgi:hypothetical protein
MTRIALSRAALAAGAALLAAGGAPAQGLKTGPSVMMAAPTAPDPVVQTPAGASAPTLGRAWRVATLPQQKPPVTRFSAAVVDGLPALRVQADASYGNFVFDLGPAAPRRVHWAWRVDQPNLATDLRDRAGDDSAVKVCLAFDMPIDKVPLIERELLRLARTRSAVPLPAATLCWVWGRNETAGSVVPNPYSKRVRYIVLRGAGDASRRWFEESRDVAADWAQAFGDESAEVPPVTAVIVAGDADNTGGQSLAFVRDLRFGP